VVELSLQNDEAPSSAEVESVNFGSEPTELLTTNAHGISGNHQTSDLPRTRRARDAGLSIIQSKA